jgi:cell division protease FtsH
MLTKCAPLWEEEQQVTFGRISTGALSDLEKVTKQARAMVTVYGLNDKIGNVTYYDSGQSEYNFATYSEETAKSLILKFHY